MALGPNEIRLTNVRLAFPKLWTPEPFPGGTDPTPYFSATFILPKNHPQIKALNDMMTRIANEKWGAKGPQVLKAAKAIGKVFLRDGDAKADMDGFEGNMFISARSKTRPGTFDNLRNPTTDADGIIYGGCYVDAVVSFFAYVKGNNGLGAGLKGVQYRGPGDAFTGAGKPADSDDFDEIGVAEGADPLTG